MEYERWAETVPHTITSDVLWKVQVYRLALFSTETGWQDVTVLMQDRRTSALADQLYRALGSISANIAEGYSREFPKERARFYEYALGSAREGRDWYYKARHILGEDVVAERLDALTQIVRLLIVMVQNQRGRQLKEETEVYDPLSE